MRTAEVRFPASMIGISSAGGVPTFGSFAPPAGSTKTFTSGVAGGGGGGGGGTAALALRQRPPALTLRMPRVFPSYASRCCWLGGVLTAETTLQGRAVRKGGVLAAKAVETQGKRQCLSGEGSGNKRQNTVP